MSDVRPENPDALAMPSDQTARVPARVNVKLRLATGAVIAIGLAATWYSYSWYRAIPLRELPEFDLSRADPAVQTEIQIARFAVQASPRSGAAWGELGQSLEAHNYLDEAQLCLAQAMQLDQHEFLWPYLRGDILYARDRVEAERCFRLAAAVRPKLALPRLRLAELFLEQRLLEQAAQEFQAAIRIEPESARAMFGLGQVAFANGDFAQARLWAEQSFDRDPEHRKTAELLLRAVHRLGDKQAIARQQALLDAMPTRGVNWDDTFTEAVKLKRRDSGGQAAAASDLLSNGNLSEATAAFERLVETEPDNPQWHSLLGMTLIRRRDYAHAAQVLETGIERHSQSAELHFHRGVVHFFLEEWAQAAGEFRRAIELKPDFRDARYNLGHTLVKLGDPEAAIAAFREAVRVRPDDAASYANLGKLLAETGDRDAAREAFKTAAKLAPRDAAIKQSLEALRTDEPK
jgi:tetratricopeptide (TPR) repeat protein